MKTRIPVADLADGQMLSCEVDGVGVLLCRVQAEYYALVNRCSHARQILSEGKLRGFEITCPLHGSRFDVRDGSCLSPPASRPVPTFAVTVNGDHAEVTVTPTHEPPKPRYGMLN